MKERILALLARIPRVRVPVRRLGYVAFFLFVFVSVAYLTFPYDRVRDYVVQEVERPLGPDGQRRPSGWQLDVVKLEPSWLTGVRAQGVRLAKASEDPEGPPLELQVDEAYARVSLWDLLTGGVGGSFGARLGGGAVDGSFSRSDALQRLELSIDGVQLRRLGLLRAFLPVPVTGTLSGEADVALHADPTQSAGTVSLEVAGLTAGDGKSKVPIEGLGDGITLERIDAGTLTLLATIEQGVADFERLEAIGPDLELLGDGNIRLADPLSRSRLEMLLNVRFTDAYRSRNDRTRAIFELIDIAPQARRARAEGGSLQYQISGLLGSNLRGTPAGRLPPPTRGGG